jgi:hypothetical protein
MRKHKQKKFLAKIHPPPPLKKIHFGSLVIQDMPMELGKKHPALEVTSVTIGWEPELNYPYWINFAFSSEPVIQSRTKLQMLASNCKRSSYSDEQCNGPNKWEVFQGMGEQAGCSMKNLVKNNTYGGRVA